MNRKIVLGLSGGMDSTTLLAVAKDSGFTPLTYGFTYGSKHNKYENEAAEQVARYYSVPYQLIDLTAAFAGFRSNLMMGQGAVPEGHYEEKSMEQTVVPARNIIFASILAGLAWTNGAEAVWLGVHAGDHAIYPDCRPHFIGHMIDALKAGTGGKVTMEAPFISLSKADIVRVGSGLGVPYRYTRTCYKNQPIACGKCGSCCERREAFAKNNLSDTVPYESLGPLPERPAV